MRPKNKKRSFAHNRIFNLYTKLKSSASRSRISVSEGPTKRNNHDSSPTTDFIVILSFIISELFPRFTGVIIDVNRQAQKDQWVLWNSKHTKPLLYRRTYVIWLPPTQISKLMPERFWIADIDKRDPLIMNIMFLKATIGQMRSLEVIKHVKNLKNTDFFSTLIHHIPIHARLIRALDSSNWSLWPTESLTIYEVEVEVTWSHFGSFGVKIKKIKNRQIIYQKEARGTAITMVLKANRGHPTPNLGVIWGKNRQNLTSRWSTQFSLNFQNIKKI